MRRLALALILLALTVPVSSQKFSFGLGAGKRRPATVTVAPFINLSLPGPLGTTATTYTPCGVAGGSSPLVTVTWSSSAGGSGTATGLTSWCVNAIPTLLVAQDSFNSSTDQTIVGLTPSPIGGTYSSLLKDTTLGANAIHVNTVGSVGPLASDTTGGATMAVLVVPSTAIVGTNYDVAIDIAAFAGALDGITVLFGETSATSYCTLTVYPGSASPDVVLSKTVSGTPTTLDTADANQGATATALVEVRGTSLTGKINGVTAVTATTTDCDNGAGVGFGFGSFLTTVQAPTTLASALFTVGANTNLTSYTSDVGGPWVKSEDTGGVTPRIVATNDSLVADASSAPANARVIMTVSPATTAPADYKVGFTSAALGSGSSNPFGVVGRYNVATGDFYGGFVYNSTANPDVKLVKRVSGLWAELGSADCAPAAGNVFELSVASDAIGFKKVGSPTCIITVTDTSITAAGVAGVAWGNATGVTLDDINLNNRLDSFYWTTGSAATETVSVGTLISEIRVVDQDATTPGIPLSAGPQTITYTATPLVGTPAVITQIVTRNVSDTQPPTVAITIPTTAATFPTAGAAINLGGTYADNIGVSTVGWTCATCTPTSGSATLTSGTWTANNIGLAVGANTIIVTATDAAMNTATDQIIITSAPSDVVDPTVSITSPNGGSNFSTTTAVQTISGTASDDSGSAQLTITYVCTNTNPLSGTASGTSSWFFTVSLFEGASTCTVTARDSALNDATDSITGTLTLPLTISTTSLPSALTGSAYAQTLSVVGGTSPYVCDNNSGGTSLGAGACTGLRITSACVVESTGPTAITTAGTCSFTAKATDNVAATDTQALSITVNSPGTPEANDYFDDLVALSAKEVAWALQEIPGQSGSSPYWSAQLNAFIVVPTNNIGGTVYDPTMGATKFTVPPWRTYYVAAVTATAWDASTPGALEVKSFTNPASSFFADDIGLKVGDEAARVIPIHRDSANLTRNIASSSVAGPTIVTLTAPHLFLDCDAVTISTTHVGETPNLGIATVKLVMGQPSQVALYANDCTTPITVTVAGTGGTIARRNDALHTRVIRGLYGTSATAHDAGVSTYLSINSLHPNSMVNIPIYPTVNGRTYLFTWDTYLDAAMIAPRMSSWKFFNLRRDLGTPPGKIHFEPNIFWNEQWGGGCDTDTTHVGALGYARTYNTTLVGQNGITHHEPLLTNNGGGPLDLFCAKPGEWIRYWVMWEQRASALDVMSMWIASESRAPVQIYNRVMLDVNSFRTFQVEANASNDDMARRPPFPDFIFWVRNFWKGSWLTEADPVAQELNLYNAYIDGKLPVR